MGWNKCTILEANKGYSRIILNSAVVAQKQHKQINAAVFQYNLTETRSGPTLAWKLQLTNCPIG